jgi:YidC/Oxa1 family membrane protein insertase
VDKRTIIGFIIIGLVIILYPLYMEWMTGEKRVQETPGRPQTEIDTLTPAQVPLTAEEKEESPPPALESEALGLAPTETQPEEVLVEVETELYKAGFSSKGGVLKSFTLRKYQYSDREDIQLLPPDGAQSALNFIFPDSSINLERYNFQVRRNHKLHAPHSIGRPDHKEI